MQRSSVMVQECEAFLAGRFGERLERDGWWLPPWVWLNRITHAQVEDLEHMAHDEADRAARHGPSEQWEQATSFLAAEILETAEHDPEAIHRLQFEVLTPIELAWISDTMVDRSPYDLVQVVRDALARSDHHSDGPLGAV